MKFIRNLSIRNKLFLISLIPLIALLYFLSADIWDKISRRNNMEKVHADVLEIEKTGNIVHAIQSERSYSVSYMATGGAEDKNELFAARMQTDRAISDLELLLKEQKQNNTFTFLDSIPRMREAVNSSERSLYSIADSYSDIKICLLQKLTKPIAMLRTPK